MTSKSGRIACPRCGANNFDTVTVCWKCGAPLVSPPAHPAGPAAAPATPFAPAAPPAPALAQGLRPGSGSTVSSERAALWLGLLFPYFGLPVGLVFMMLDDDRKQQLGRTCVLWSCISMVLHVAFMSVAALGMREMLMAVLQGARGAASRPGGMGGL
jgi:hypothetical protein